MNHLKVSARYPNSNIEIQFDWSDTCIFRLVRDHNEGCVFIHDKIEGGGLGDVVYSHTYNPVPPMLQIIEDISMNKRILLYG